MKSAEIIPFYRNGSIKVYGKPIYQIDFSSFKSSKSLHDWTEQALLAIEGSALISRGQKIRSYRLTDLFGELFAMNWQKCSDELALTEDFGGRSGLSFSHYD
jgi:hypothetical protein